MIQPGMMFGGEGPIMQGTWYNPRTGDAFTVRDSFFEDNQYVVTTTDGRYLHYDQLQNYVQTDMKLDDIKNMNQSAPVNAEPIPTEVSNLIADNARDEMMLPEDMELLNTAKTNVKLGNIHSSPVFDDPIPPVNMNTAIIEKALKNAAMPDFSVSLKWDKYPAKQIEMLKDIMDIPVDEIIDWYLDNISINDFIVVFKNALTDKIMCNACDTQVTECVECVSDSVIVDLIDVVNPKEKPTTKRTASKTKTNKKVVKK